MGNFVNFWQFFSLSIFTFQLILISYRLQRIYSLCLPYSWYHSKILTFDQFMGQNLSNLLRMPKYGHFGFGYVPVIWHNWAKKGPNMGVAVPRALVGG